MRDLIHISEIKREICNTNSVCISAIALNDEYTIKQSETRMSLFYLELLNTDGNTIFEKDFKDDVNIFSSSAASYKIDSGRVVKRKNNKLYIYYLVTGYGKDPSSVTERYLYIVMFEFDQDNNEIRFIKKIPVIETSSYIFNKIFVSNTDEKMILSVLDSNGFGNKIFIFDYNTEQIMEMQYSRNLVNQDNGVPAISYGAALSFDKKFIFLTNREAIFVYTIHNLQNVSIIRYENIFKYSDVDILQGSFIYSRFDNPSFYLIGRNDNVNYSLEAVYDENKDSIKLIHNYNYDEIFDILREKYDVDIGYGNENFKLISLGESENVVVFNFYYDYQIIYGSSLAIYSKHTNELLDVIMYETDGPYCCKTRFVSCAVSNLMINPIYNIDSNAPNQLTFSFVQNRYQLRYNLLSSCEKSKVLYNIRTASVFSSGVVYGEEVVVDDLDPLSCGNVGSTNIRMKENICKNVIK